MNVKIKLPIGSHGKAEIVSYVHEGSGPEYRPAPTIRDGFKKAEYHWDENEYCLIHKPYELSPEEQAEADALAEAEAFKVAIPDMVREMQAEIFRLQTELAEAKAEIEKLKPKEVKST